MSTLTVQPIPVTDVRPGDLIDTANAYSPGPVIRVRAVAWCDHRMHIQRYESGALVPESYVFDDDQRVDLYARP